MVRQEASRSVVVVYARHCLLREALRGGAAAGVAS